MSKTRFKTKMVKDDSYIVENSKIVDDLKIVNNINPPIQKLSISLKYFQQNYCSFTRLSQKDKKIMKSFDSFIKLVGTLNNWKDMPKGKIPRTLKTGDEGQKRLKALGFDIKQTPLIHYKLTNVARVHGIEIGSRFKLIFLDPEHKIDK